MLMGLCGLLVFLFNNVSVSMHGMRVKTFVKIS